MQEGKHRKGDTAVKAVNIQWDTDGDMEAAAQLPQEIEIPDSITEDDAVSDYISEATGCCHAGFVLEQ